MARISIVVGFLALATAAAVADPAPALSVGAMVTVRPNAIWFERQEALGRWQQLKQAGSVEDLADYEHEALSHRDAWQFTNPLAAKVVGFDATHAQVNVEMQTSGRLKGTNWFLDAGAIEH